MRTHWTAWLVLALLVATAVAADAQEKGAVGLVMGYPASVGVLWHASDDFALRPEVTFTKSSSDVGATSAGNGSSGDSWGVGVGLSGLFYAGKWDALRTYFSPRFTYSRAETDSLLTGSSTPVSSSTNWVVSVSGSFGAQYSLGKRFGVFGEVGLAYSYGKATYSGSFAATDTTSHSWGPRTGVGVIFYF